MPAVNAAPEALPSEPNATGTSPAETSSSLKGVANLLNLPADITEKITADAETRKLGEKQESEAPTRDSSSSSSLDSEEQETGEKIEDEHEDEDEHDPAEQGSPFKDERVQKRISKEVRRRGKAEERAAQLEQELEDAKAEMDDRRRQTAAVAGPQAPVNKGLLGQVTNEQQLGQWEEHATTQMEWCDANADGVTVGEGNAQRFVEPTEIAKYRQEMEKVLLQAPKRRQEIRDALGQRMGAVQHYDTIAKAEAPELWDAQSPQHQQLATIGQEDEVIAGFLRDNPGVLNDPRINVLLTRYVRGYQSRNQPSEISHQKSRDPDLPESLTRKHPPIAPITADPPSRSAAPTGMKRVAEAMQNVVNDGGSPESMIAAIRARREAAQRNGSTRSNGHALAPV